MFLGIALLSFLSVAFGSAGVTYHGRLLKPTGEPVSSTTVDFKIQIRTPGNENCLMYEEVQRKDLSASNGVFAITINDGSGTVSPGNFSLDRVFQNRGAFTFTAGKCVINTPYTPNPADGRRLVVEFDDGTGWEPMPAQAVNFVPMSLEAMTVGGYNAGSLLRVEDPPVMGITPLANAQYNTLLDLVNGTSTQYLRPTSTLDGSRLSAGSVANGSITSLAWSKLTGVPAPLTQIGGLACADGKILKTASGAWTCADETGGGGGLPAAGGANGKYLKSDGTNWAGANVTFADIKNSVGGSAFNLAGCAANQTVSWSSLTDMFTCQNIGSLDGAAITSGTIASARLPAGASMWQDGGSGKIYYNGGNIGVGTNAPASPLEVSTTYTGATDMNAVKTSAVWSPSSAPSGAWYVGNSNEIQSGGSASLSNAGMEAVWGQATHARTGTINNLRGGEFQANNGASGSINDARGIAGTVSNGSSGTIASASGAVGQVTNTGGGAITQAYGIQANVDNTSGTINYAYGLKTWFSNAGTITNGYGVYIDTVTGANKFGLYQSDPANPNYFAGNIGIGTTNPQSKLDVNGILRVPTICDETGANCKTISSGWGSGGSVTSVLTGTGLTGGPITTTGTISIAPGGVGATELATNAVTTAKIADGNITGVKLETLAGLSTGTYGSATAIPAVTIDTKGRVTAITTNNISGLLPSAGGANGKYLKSDGTNWAGANVTFSDIKNSVGGSAFNLAGCAANQTVSWSSLTDMFTCQNIGSLDGAAITSGTIASARLPAGASMWQDGGAGKIYYNSGDVGIGTTDPQAQMQLSKTYAGSADYRSLWNSLIITGTPITARGIQSWTNANHSSGTITNLGGIYAQTDVSNGGSATNVIGISTWGNLGGAGSVTNWASLDVAAPGKSGSGAITNWYGLRIGDGAVATNNYSIYTGSAKSYFGGNVGIGTTAPWEMLDVQAAGSSPTIRVASTGGGTSYPNMTIQNFGAGVPQFTFKNANGTQASPTASVSGDWLGTIGFIGHNGSGMASDQRGVGNAGILAVADANFGANSYPTSMKFYTTPSGANMSAERMRIDSNGNVGIGTTSPDSALNVAGNVKTSGQLATGSQIITGGTAAIDWNGGNSISTDYNCASTLSFANLRDGGTYTLVVTSTATTQCNFPANVTGLDAGSVTYRFRPANAARAASSHTVYTLMRVGSVVYVSWMTGF